MRIIALATAALLTATMDNAGCSVYMSATRSTYKDTSLVTIGADHAVVFRELGPPHASVKLENGG